MSVPSAAFLDRDGTLIRDVGYPGDPADVRLLPRVPEAIARLNRRGVPAIVVTNQSGIGRGLYTERDFRTVQAELERRLALRGSALDAVFHCPHDPERDTCACRKPGLELYRRAARRFGIALSEAMYVGDRPRDVAAAAETGGRGYLVRSGRALEGSPPEGCRVVEDLWEAVARELGETGMEAPGEPDGRETGTAAAGGSGEAGRATRDPRGPGG